MAKEKQYKLKFKPTPIARLSKRAKTPFHYVGYPHANNWDRYYKLTYEFMIAEKRKNQPEIRKAKPKPIEIGRKQFQNNLLAANYENIGRGAFANVFAKPNSDIVVKVAEVPDSWPAYAKWATEQGFAGTFAPKVYSLKFYSPKNDRPFYVATMERLVDTINGIKESGPHSNTELTNLFERLVNSINNGAVYGRGDVKEYPDLYAFAQALRDQDFRWDLHGGNVMVRKDGQIVVTDPQSESRDSDFRIRKGKIIPAIVSA